MSITDPLPECVDEPVGNPNRQARRGQNIRWLLLVGFAAVLGGLVFYLMNFGTPSPSDAPRHEVMEARRLATADLAGPAAISPEAENTRLRGQMADLQQQLQATMDQNAHLATENAALTEQVPEPTTDARLPHVFPTRQGPASGQTGAQPPASGDAASTPPARSAASPLFSEGEPPAEEGAASSKRTIRLLSTDAAGQPGSGDPSAEPAGPSVSTYDTSQFVSPNAYVPARVLVGVDMQTGTAASADPKPVLFRVEGKAVGVGQAGHVQTSDLTGCLVNGAAYAELSSEKVYVKLQKMSCPAGENKTLVENVDGYVTYMGKAGVRGRVVSREGGLASKAMLAGTLQGLGQAMTASVQRSQTAIVTGGEGGNLASVPPTGAQIGQEAVGSGVGNASSLLADYYIKRAEQYQPVIEMPTGLEVELVFLNAVRFAEPEDRP